MTKGTDPVVASMIDKLTQRVHAISQKQTYNPQPSVQVATEVLWGVMFVRGKGTKMYTPNMRTTVAREIRNRCDVGWAGATELINKALSLLNQHGYIHINGDMVTPTPNPKFKPELLGMIDRRWMEPHLHTIKPPIDANESPSFAMVGDSSLWITFSKSLKGISAPHKGVVDAISFDRPLRYCWDTAFPSRLGSAGAKVYPKMSRIRKVLSRQSFRRFAVPDLSIVKPSGDPLAASALAVAAYGPDPVTVDTKTIHFRLTQDNFDVIERSFH